MQLTDRDKTFLVDFILHTIKQYIVHSTYCLYSVNKNCITVIIYFIYNGVQDKVLIFSAGL